MKHSKSSSLRAGDAAWSKAAEREPVIRRLAGLKRVREGDLRSAMRDLQLGRSQICLLLARYRSNPVPVLPCQNDRALSPVDPICPNLSTG